VFRTIFSKSPFFIITSIILTLALSVALTFTWGCDGCGDKEEQKGVDGGSLQRAEVIYRELEVGLKKNRHDPVLAAGFVQSWIAENAEELSRLFGKFPTDEAATKRVIYFSVRGRKAVKIQELEDNEDFKRASLAFLKLNSHLISTYLKRLKAQKDELKNKKVPSGS